VEGGRAGGQRTGDGVYALLWRTAALEVKHRNIQRIRHNRKINIDEMHVVWLSVTDVINEDMHQYRLETSYSTRLWKLTDR
jgi:hypothetical protein